MPILGTSIFLPIFLGNSEIILFALLLVALATIFFLARKYNMPRHNNEGLSDSILNNIQDGVYRTDLDGNLIWCSLSTINLLGINSPGIIKKVNVKDFYVYPEQRNELLAKLKENGKVANYEALMRRMDGKQITISCNISYWRNSNGKILGIEGIFRDITEQRRAREALIESEERYRSVVEGAIDEIFSVNYDGIFLFMNKVAAQKLGGTPENFIGMSMWDVFPKSIADRQMASIKQVFKTGRGKSDDTLVVLKSRKYSYSTNLQPIKDNSGKISSVLGIARDVTRSVQVQNDLRNKCDFVSSLLDTANSLIICLDKYARITVFNKEIEKLTGYSCDDVIGKSWPDIFLPEDHYHHKIENFEDWVRKYPSDRLEGQIKTKSGELRTILWSNSAMFHPDSDDFTALAIGHDITDRVMTEKVRLESETRFKEALDYSRDILYRLNLKTNTYDYMSDSVFDITGFTSEEVIAMGADGVNALVHPEDKHLHINYRYKLIGSNQGDQATYYTESRIKGKNGQYIWLGDSHTLVRNSNGIPLYIIGSARDITEQKKSKIQQEARLELLNNLRHVSDIDFCLDLGCKAIYETGLFERSVLTMHNDKKEIINIGYAGLDKEIVDVARNAPAPSDELIKKMTMDKFRIGSSYFIPEESGVFNANLNRRIAQDNFENAGNSSWRTGDELFVPIRGEKNKIYGWLSVDTPFDNNRPTRETVRILEEIVDIVTQKIREIKYLEKFHAENKALHESEEKYRNLINSSPDAIVILQNGRARFVNSAYIKLLGYTLDEVSGDLGFVNSIHKDELEAVFQRMKDRRAGKKLSNVFAVTLISKDGREIPCETSNSQIQYQGKPAEFITMRDVTERKRIEKEREDSERRYRELFDSILEGIGLVDENEIVQYCNPAFLKIFEVDSSDKIIGRTLFDFVSDEQKQIISSQTMKRKENISSQYEIEIITSKGNKKTLYVSSSPHFDESNRYIGAFGALIDITDRKKMMDALLQSEQFSKAIIKYSPIGVSVRSNTGKLLSANDAWINIWGHTEEEMINFSTREKTELEFDYCDEYLGRWLPELKHIYKEGGYLHVPDVQVINPKKKDTLYVSQYFYAIKDKSGNVERVVILTEDITARKMAEDKIKAINVEKIEQAKRIAGTFAHEIRNALFPATASLNRIKLSSQANNSNSEGLKKYSSIAERSITRAADITGLISSYTKLDSEQMPERVNLNEIIQELLNNNQLRLIENNVRVNVSGQNNCMVKSNRRQLLLAFNNLLLNSVDALDGKKNKNIAIKWLSNGDSQNVSFEDSGCGVPSEYLDRVFEPFFSKKSETGGTGLGLAMTKRIIEMYGGTISVRSALSTGTVFNIKLKKYRSGFNNKLE